MRPFIRHQCLVLGLAALLLPAGCGVVSSGGSEIRPAEIELFIQAFLGEVPFEAWEATVLEEVFEQNDAPNTDEFVGCEEPMTWSVGFVSDDPLMLLTPNVLPFTVTVDYDACQIVPLAGEPTVTGDLEFDAETDASEGTISGTLDIETTDDLVQQAYAETCTLTGDWTLDAMSYTVDFEIECGGDTFTFREEFVEEP